MPIKDFKVLGQTYYSFRNSFLHRLKSTISTLPSPSQSAVLVDIIPINSFLQILKSRMSSFPSLLKSHLKVVLVIRGVAVGGVLDSVGVDVGGLGTVGVIWQTKDTGHGATKQGRGSYLHPGGGVDVGFKTSVGVGVGVGVNVGTLEGVLVRVGVWQTS